MDPLWSCDFPCLLPATLKDLEEDTTNNPMTQLEYVISGSLKGFSVSTQNLLALLPSCDSTLLPARAAPQDDNVITWAEKRREELKVLETPKVRKNVGQL